MAKTTTITISLVNWQEFRRIAEELGIGHSMNDVAIELLATYREHEKCKP